MEPEWPVEPEGVGVGEQFGRVETCASRRIVGSLDAKAVPRPGAEPGGDAAKDAAPVARHRDAENLVIAVVEAQRCALGVGENERRFEAALGDRNSESGARLAHGAGPAMER